MPVCRPGCLSAKCVKTKYLIWSHGIGFLLELVKLLYLFVTLLVEFLIEFSVVILDEVFVKFLIEFFIEFLVKFFVCHFVSDYWVSNVEESLNPLQLFDFSSVSNGKIGTFRQNGEVQLLCVSSDKNTHRIVNSPHLFHRSC